MQSLPPEILEIILLQLSCKQIILAHRTCKSFKLLNLNDLLKKKAMKGFPRLSGECNVHEIPMRVINDKPFDEVNMYIVLNYLYDSDIDVVKGDIVLFSIYRRGGLLNPSTYYDTINIRDSEICIFDGLKLIKLEYKSPNMYKRCKLLKEFHVIENNTPIKYWYTYKLNYDLFNHDNIWFDHKLVREQCLNNIKYEMISHDMIFTTINFKVHGIYTYFIYNNNKYYIIFDYYGSKAQFKKSIDSFSSAFLNNDCLNNFLYAFKNILNTDDIEFYVTSYINMIKSDDNILFVRSYIIQ